MIGTSDEKQFHKKKAMDALDRMKNAIDKDKLQDADYHHEADNYHIEEAKYKSQQYANPKAINKIIEKVDPNLVDEDVSQIERNVKAPVAVIASVIEEQINSEQPPKDLPTTEIVQKATKQIADQIIQQIDIKKIVKKQSSAVTTAVGRITKQKKLSTQNHPIVLL